MINQLITIPYKRIDFFKSTILRGQWYIYQMDTQCGLNHHALLQRTHTFNVPEFCAAYEYIQAIQDIPSCGWWRCYRMAIHQIFDNFPIYKKNHYVEIVLDLMGLFYDVLPHHLLKLVRINLIKPLYSGNDKTGDPMASWAIYAIIEV